MMRTLFVVSLFASSLAFSQGKPLEDRKAISFSEIERGLFFGVSAGFWGTVNPPAGPGSAQYFSSGQAALIEMGYDIGERVSPAIFFLASSSRMGADYTGTARSCGPGGPIDCGAGMSPQALRSGDYGFIAPGLGARIRIAGVKDNQDVARTWFYVRLGGAFALYQPATLIERPELLLFAGPGLEYFTRLRHFSIGLDGNINFGLNFVGSPPTLGFSVLPFVRYAGF